MLNNLLILILGMLLVLTGSKETSAALPLDQLEMSMEVTVNPTEEGASTVCRTSKKVEPKKMQWWITIARTRPHAQKDLEVVDNGVRCGSGSIENGSPDLETEHRSPYMTAKFSTYAGLLPSMLIPERVLVLEISLSLQKLAGFERIGSPVYKESVEKRKFYFLERGEALIPLMVADKDERKELGLYEVFLHLSVERITKEPAEAYGSISVTSENVGGELHLDGGVVGDISATSAVVLRNVPIGLREVVERDTSGNYTRKVVRVEPNRTALVRLESIGLAQNAVRYRLMPLGKNVNGYEEYKREVDGAVVVKIPAGEFLMGNRETEGSPLEHKVYVSDFLIDKTSVTWEQYKKFTEATGISLPPRNPYWGINDNHPVVFVTWEEAKAYCEWSGGRLPTEAEREKAARGTDRRKYPWGNEEPDPQRAVFRSEWGYKATDVVGTHPMGASTYGLLDMGGNVWEWCSDWFDQDYFEVSPYRDPQGPKLGRAHVVKGGSWDSRPSVLSSSSRNFGYRGYRELDFGFRCAMNVPR